VLADLKKLADHHNVALVVVQHLRKMPAGDILDTVSGSN